MDDNQMQMLISARQDFEKFVKLDDRANKFSDPADAEPFRREAESCRLRAGEKYGILSAAEGLPLRLPLAADDSDSLERLEKIFLEKYTPEWLHAKYIPLWTQFEHSLIGEIPRFLAPILSAPARMSILFRPDGMKDYLWKPHTASAERRAWKEIDTGVKGKFQFLPQPPPPADGEVTSPTPTASQRRIIPGRQGGAVPEAMVAGSMAHTAPLPGPMSQDQTMPVVAGQNQEAPRIPVSNAELLSKPAAPENAMPGVTDQSRETPLAPGTPAPRPMAGADSPPPPLQDQAMPVVTGQSQEAPRIQGTTTPGPASIAGLPSKPAAPENAMPIVSPESQETPRGLDTPTPKLGIESETLNSASPQSYMFLHETPGQEGVPTPESVRSRFPGFARDPESAKADLALIFPFKLLPVKAGSDYGILYDQTGSLFEWLKPQSAPAHPAAGMSLDPDKVKLLHAEMLRLQIRKIQMVVAPPDLQPALQQMIRRLDTKAMAMFSKQTVFMPPEVFREWIEREIKRLPVFSESEAFAPVPTTPQARSRNTLPPEEKIGTEKSSSTTFWRFFARERGQLSGTETPQIIYAQNPPASESFPDLYFSPDRFIKILENPVLHEPVSESTRIFESGAGARQAGKFGVESFTSVETGTTQGQVVPSTSPASAGPSVERSSSVPAIPGFEFPGSPAGNINAVSTQTAVASSQNTVLNGRIASHSEPIGRVKDFVLPPDIRPMDMTVSRIGRPEKSALLRPETAMQSLILLIGGRKPASGAKSIPKTPERLGRPETGKPAPDIRLAADDRDTSDVPDEDTGRLGEHLTISQLAKRFYQWFAKQSAKAREQNQHPKQV